MKKFIKLSSIIALLLAMIICFSGCGLAEFTRSLITKDKNSIDVDMGEDSTSSPITDYTENPTVNQQIIPSTSTPVPSATKPNTTKPSIQGSDTTIAPPETNAPTTQKPNGGIKEEPVKDIQDLLFASDPNTASKVLETAGFAYDEAQGIFYTPLYPWQRYFGYNVGFDMAAPIAGMVFDTKRIEFEYKGKEWMIQLWKGQYGITAGAEIGLYNRDPEKVMQYDCADDEDLIEMQFDFYNMGEYVFSRGPEKHWWLTGFKVFHLGIPFTITMDMTLKFTDNDMATAFLQSLKKQQHTDILNPIRYKRYGSTIRILWGPAPDGLEF
jgi:hypothetical protein